MMAETVQSSTELVLIGFKTLYHKLRNGITLDNEHLFDVYKNYPVLLAGPNKEMGIEGIMQIFDYAANRLPQQLLLQKVNHIFLYSGPEYFSKPLHGRGRPKYRSRWHVIDEDNTQDEKNIILQIRGNTDVFGEIFPMLAGLELVRRYAKANLDNHGVFKLLFGKYVEILRRN